jgi:hypothetical protein
MDQSSNCPSQSAQDKKKKKNWVQGFEEVEIWESGRRSGM